MAKKKTDISLLKKILSWIINLIFGGVFVTCTYIFIFFSAADLASLPDGAQSLLIVAFLISAYWLVISLSFPEIKINHQESE